MKKCNQDLQVIIPQGGANLQLPDDCLLNFYENLENRTIWIDAEIDVYTLNVIHYIMKWNKEDADADIPVENRTPIKLLFFSPGGCLDTNYAIIDAIKLSKTPVHGINMGQCASAAAFIYLSCHVRLMLPHAYFLFHQGSGQLSGTFAEIYAQMEDYEKQVVELANFMTSHTGYTTEEIEENIAGEWFVRRDEAIEKKVADRVVTNLSEIY